jgi:aspartate kinase
MRGPWHPAHARGARGPHAALAIYSPLVPEIVVMKFGGTSVADAKRIKRAASRIVEKREEGHDVVAVLSARGKTTDELIAMADEVSSAPDPREMDMLLSTGERISCALCAMAIHDLGHRAISFTGSQAGIVTDTWHTKARIVDVRADRIRTALSEDRIVLVAGFQGVSTSADVTTLGRGGSDTTAVAVAAALNARECEIYTDVAGVYSADPRIVPDARMLPYVSFEEMLELSAAGAGVLQLRSVEYARNHAVRIHCRSSFEDCPGTLVMSEGESMERMEERPLVTGVAYSTAESMVTLRGVPNEPGTAARLFEVLADSNVKVDMIDQNVPLSAAGKAEISFTVPHEDMRVATGAIEPLEGELFESMHAQEQMGKVSIVGAGMRSHPGVAAKVFRVLAEERVNIDMISTSPVRISCVIARERVEQAVRALHSAFELSEADTIAQEDPFAAGGL